MFAYNSRSQSISSQSSTKIAEPPEMKAGYMKKQTSRFKVWIQRYFWLEKGVLSNFMADVDSTDNDKIKERKHKQINLRDYKLISNKEKNTLLIQSKFKGLVCRDDISLYIEIDYFYDLWEFAFKEHIAYANLPISQLIPNKRDSGRTVFSSIRSSPRSNSINVNSNVLLSTNGTTKGMTVLNGISFIPQPDQEQSSSFRSEAEQEWEPSSSITSPFITNSIATYRAISNGSLDSSTDANNNNNNIENEEMSILYSASSGSLKSNNNNNNNNNNINNPSLDTLSQKQSDKSFTSATTVTVTESCPHSPCSAHNNNSSTNDNNKATNNMIHSSSSSLSSSYSPPSPPSSSVNTVSTLAKLFPVQDHWTCEGMNDDDDDDDDDLLLNKHTINMSTK